MLFLALPALAIFFIIEGADLLDFVDFRNGTWLALLGSTSMDVLLGNMEDMVYAIYGVYRVCRLITS